MGGLWAYIHKPSRCNQVKYKYKSKKPFIFTYLSIIFIGIILTIGRWYSIINPSFVVFSPEIHSHISNLSLSLIAYTGIGYSWLLFGVKFHRITILGAFLILANFIYETLISLMNTPDIIDAIYGTVGILLAYIYLTITNKYGLLEDKHSSIGGVVAEGIHHRVEDNILGESREVLKEDIGRD